MIFSLKDFYQGNVHTSICMSLDFSHRIFTKRFWRHKYADSVSPKLSN
jgi:hypothetical protein